MRLILIAAIAMIGASVVLAQTPTKPSERGSVKATPKSETRPAPRTAAKKGALGSVIGIDVAALKAPPAKSALARIIRTQSLRICVRSDVPPFGYFASQGLIGFDISLAKEIAVQLSIYYKKNLTINWQVIEAGERISKLQQKSCDFVAAAFSYTKARAKKVAFSSIYMRTDKVAIAARTITRSTPVIALVRGTTNYAKGLKGVARYFGNYKEIMHAMKNGEVDYVVADRPMAKHMTQSVTKSFQFHRAFPQKEEYGIGVHLKHTSLLAAINRALRDLAKSGRLAYLNRQWL